MMKEKERAGEFSSPHRRGDEKKGRWRQEATRVVFPEELAKEEKKSSTVKLTHTGL